MSDPQEGTEGTEGKEAEGGDDRFSEDYVLQPSSTPGLGYQSDPDVDPEAEAAAEALALTEEMATGDITIPDDYVMVSEPWNPMGGDDPMGGEPAPMMDAMDAALGSALDGATEQAGNTPAGPGTDSDAGGDSAGDVASVDEGDDDSGGDEVEIAAT